MPISTTLSVNASDSAIAPNKLTDHLASLDLELEALTSSEKRPFKLVLL